MINANSYRSTVLLANLYQLGEFKASLIVLLMEVARIDAHLLYIRRNGDSRLCRKVDIGHQGDIVSFIIQVFTDIDEVLNILLAGTGDSYQLATGVIHPNALLRRSDNIIRMGVAHRLHNNRITSANNKLFADFYGNCANSVLHRLFFWLVL